MALGMDRDYRLRWMDFDQYGRLQPFALLDMCQDVATLQAEEMGIGHDEMLARGVFAEWQLAGIMDFMEKRGAIADLLGEGHGFANSGRTCILIGNESHRPELEGTGMITERYYGGGQTAGWIGVVGPTRMNYAKLIPYIDYFAGAVGKMLREVLGE